MPPVRIPTGAAATVSSPATAVTAAADHALVRLAIAGDVEAFEQLYRGHAGMVHALARRLMGSNEADDLTQEVFVRAWQKLATFRGEAGFAAWLRRLATNLLVNAWRRHAAAVAGDVEPVAPPASLPWRLDLEAAIATLPAGARAVFVLHDVEGHDHAGIAALLGVSVGTSKSQLHRARALLRDRLGGEPG